RKLEIERVVHRAAAEIVDALRHAAESDSSWTIENQRSRELGDASRRGEVACLVAERLAEERSDVLALGLAPPDGVEHRTDDEPPWNRREDVVRKDAVVLSFAPSEDDDGHAELQELRRERLVLRVGALEIDAIAEAHVAIVLRRLLADAETVRRDEKRGAQNRRTRWRNAALREGPLAKLGGIRDDHAGRFVSWLRGRPGRTSSEEYPNCSFEGTAGRVALGGFTRAKARLSVDRGLEDALVGSIPFRVVSFVVLCRLSRSWF